MPNSYSQRKAKCSKKLCFNIVRLNIVRFSWRTIRTVDKSILICLHNTLTQYRSSKYWPKHLPSNRIEEKRRESAHEEAVATIAIITYHCIHLFRVGRKEGRKEGGEGFVVEHSWEGGGWILTPVKSTKPATTTQSSLLFRPIGLIRYHRKKRVWMDRVQYERYALTKTWLCSLYILIIIFFIRKDLRVHRTSLAN